MAELQYNIGVQGQELQADDLNLLAKSALMDDRIIAELFRLPPYNGSTVTKAILPHGGLSDTTPTISPNGASGSVLVSPFRAIIGSRTAVGTDVSANYRDIRSSIFVGASALTATQPITANSSGNPRWDLVYATVTPDLSSPTVTRYVKDPTTGVIATSSVVVSLSTKVVINIFAGTPGASPSLPALPADAGGNYNIPLAYIRVPNGFNGVSTVGLGDIYSQAPVFPLSRVTGASSVLPASENNRAGGTAITTAREQSWGSSGTPPTAYIPPYVVGSESIWVALDLRDAGNAANWSHQDGTVIDGSRDWRYRAFHTVGQAQLDATGSFPWKSSPSGTITPNSAITGRLLECMGQSWFDDSGTFASIGAGNATVAYLSGAGIVSGTTNAFASGVVAVYCDLTTGALKLRATSFPQCLIFLKIESSAPFKLA